MERLDGPAESCWSTTAAPTAFEVMRRGRGPALPVIRLSRNFGHQIALTAGLDHAAGDAAIVMDADLQDPPEVVLELATRWREGYDVVYAVRDSAGRDRAKLRPPRGSTACSAASPSSHPGGCRRLPPRRPARARRARVDARAPPLPARHVRVGRLRPDRGAYTRPTRFAGDTKYPLRKMLRFASTASSGSRRRRCGSPWTSASSSLVSFLAGDRGDRLKVTGLYAVPGWASIVVVLASSGGVQLTVLGVIGEYLARIHDEVKRRPLYGRRRAGRDGERCRLRPV